MNMGIQVRLKKIGPYYCRRQYENAIDEDVDNTKRKY